MTALIQHWGKPAKQDKKTSCAWVLLQHWRNPVMQHQKFTLCDSIDTTLKWTCKTGSDIHPAPQYYHNIEVILFCNIRNWPCMTVSIRHWGEPAIRGQKYILCRSITATLRQSCYATLNIHPEWQYWYNVEAILLSRMEHEPCTTGLVRPCLNVASQGQGWYSIASGYVVAWDCGNAINSCSES